MRDKIELCKIKIVRSIVIICENSMNDTLGL